MLLLSLNWHSGTYLKNKHQKFSNKYQKFCNNIKSIPVNKYNLLLSLPLVLAVLIKRAIKFLTKFPNTLSGLNSKIKGDNLFFNFIDCFRFQCRLEFLNIHK